MIIGRIIQGVAENPVYLPTIYIHIFGGIENVSASGAPLFVLPNKHSVILTGPQITPPHDTNILQSINQNLKPKEGQASFSEDLSGFKENLINPKDFVDGYYNTLKKMVYDESMNSKFDKKIVYSAMHGI